MNCSKTNIVVCISYQQFQVVATETLNPVALEADIHGAVATEKIDGTCCYVTLYNGEHLHNNHIEALWRRSERCVWAGQYIIIIIIKAASSVERVFDAPQAVVRTSTSCRCLEDSAVGKRGKF